MTSETSQMRDASPDPTELLLEWQSHPVRERRDKIPLVVAVLVGLPLVIWWAYGGFFAVLSIVLLTLSLGSFFLPTKYALYRGGGEMKFFGIARRFAWSQFRSFYPDRHGVLLSPFTRPSRLENFRGIYLRFGERADDIMRIVEECMLRKPGAVDATAGDVR